VTLMHGIVVLKRTKCKESRKSYYNVTDVGRFYDRVTKIHIIHPFAIQVLKKFQFKLGQWCRN